MKYFADHVLPIKVKYVYAQVDYSFNVQSMIDSYLNWL